MIPIIFGMLISLFLGLTIWAIETDRGKTFHLSLAAFLVTTIYALTQF